MNGCSGGDLGQFAIDEDGTGSNQRLDAEQVTRTSYLLTSYPATCYILLATPDQRLADPSDDGFGVLWGDEVVGISNRWCGLSVLIPVHDASAMGRVGG